MAKENETVADIIAERRALADRLEHEMAVAKECKELTAHRTAQAIIDSTHREADRLEAAHKREVDAHKREVDALNEQIADLRQQRDLWSKRSAELVEKCNEHYAKLKQVGNAAKLREALKDIGRLVEQIHFLYSDYPSEIHEIARKVNAAPAAPPRNCDVGTAEEQDERFHRFCVMQRKGSCAGCPDPVGGRTCANGIRECALVWAQMPYEEGGAK